MPRNSNAVATTGNRSLATSDPVELLEQAEVLRRRAEQSFGEYALEAGRLLIAAKRKIPHGSWAQHIAEHTGFSLRTAEVYMRARKRYDQLPAADKASVLEQPFTRSLLVLAQAPRPSLSEATVIEQAPRQRNGATAPVRDFLEQRDIDTTRLLQEAVDYNAGTAPAAEEDFPREPTPFDDIESIVGRPSSQATSDVDLDDLAPQTQDEQMAEALKEIEERDQEIQRLEQELRRTNQALDSAREAMLTAVAPSSPQRGWDYIANLAQYLKADEPQRTPATLAKRAASIPGGREMISYLEMFFTATRSQLNEVA